MPRLYLNPHGSQLDREGRAQLFFKVKLFNKWHRVYTGIKIFPAAWNVQGQEVISGKGEYNVSTINKAIHNQREKLQAILLQDPQSIEDVRSAMKEKRIQQPKQITLLEMFDHIKEKYANKYAPNYIRSAKATKQALTYFNKSIQFSDLNQQFFDEFCDWLIDQEKASATIAKHAKFIRMACREAEKMNIKVPRHYTDFTYREDREQPIWLSWDEVQKLVHYNCDGTEERIKDTFLFRTFTGIRQSDLPYVKNIIGKEMFFDIYKTKKQHTIILNKHALQIVEKYGGPPPFYSQQHENRIIKEVCKAAEIDNGIKTIKYSGQQRIIQHWKKYEKISSHTARRTFARLWVDRGGSIVHLSKYLGHSSIATTQKYIGFTDEEIGNEALRLFD